MNSLLVEPSFLHRVSHQTLSTPTSEAQALVDRARGTKDANLHIKVWHNTELLIRTSDSGVEQIYIPDAVGLRMLLLHEMHTSPLAGHLGTRRMIPMLLARAWWPKLRATVTQFC